MFSKNYTASLFTFLPNSYASKYKQISSYYINRSAYEDSSLYGLRRQHSYLNKLSLLNSNTTFLDVNSINKLLFLNYQNNAKFESTVSNNANSFFFFNKTADFNNNFQSAFVSNVFKTYFNNLNATSANNFFLYTNLTSLINNDSDEKKINNALFAVFNDRYFDENLFFLKENNNQITNISSDIFVNIDNVPTLFFFANTNKSYKSHLLFAPNQSISMVNRNIRTFVNSIHSLSNLNYSTDLNEVSSDLRNSNSRAFLNNFYFYKKLNSVQLSPLTSSKILSNRLNPDYPYSPINSSNANINSLNFDSHKFTFVENTPTVLQGKDELIPSFIPSIY